LSASRAALTIEESTHYAEVIGPLQAQQVVLRAVCCGVAEVRWLLERVKAAAANLDSSRLGTGEPAGPDPGGTSD
jgi:hypothetical protein